MTTYIMARPLQRATSPTHRSAPAAPWRHTPQHSRKDFAQIAAESPCFTFSMPFNPIAELIDGPQRSRHTSDALPVPTKPLVMTAPLLPRSSRTQHVQATDSSESESLHRLAALVSTDKPLHTDEAEVVNAALACLSLRDTSITTYGRNSARTGDSVTDDAADGRTHAHARMRSLSSSSGAIARLQAHALRRQSYINTMAAGASLGAMVASLDVHGRACGGQCNVASPAAAASGTSRAQLYVCRKAMRSPHLPSLTSSDTNGRARILRTRRCGASPSAGSASGSAVAGARPCKQYTTTRSKCYITPEEGKGNAQMKRFVEEVRQTKLVARCATQPKEQESITAEAAASGQTESVRALLEKGASPNVTTPGAKPPLFAAIERRHPEVVKLLLAAGADPNAQWLGRSCLLAAYETQQKNLFRALLDAGANVHTTYGMDKATLLFMAVDDDRFDDVVDLLEKGASVRVACAGRSAIVAACQRDRFSLAVLLLNAGADPNDVYASETPLIIAAQNGNAALAGLLISKGARVNVKDDLGCTPLHYAACKGAEMLVSLLLDYGADPMWRDTHGRLPSEVALLHGHTALAAFLMLYQKRYTRSLLRAARDVLRRTGGIDVASAEAVCVPDELLRFVNTSAV